MTYGMLRSLAFMLCLAATARGQVGVALGDVATATGRAAATLTAGAIRTATGVAIAVPVQLGNALAVEASTLVVDSAIIGVNAGTSVVEQVAVATKDVSFGLAKMGWHLVFPRRRKT